MLYQEFKDITETVSGASLDGGTEMLIEQRDVNGDLELIPVRQAEIRYTFNRSGNGEQTSRIVFRA